MNKYIITVFLLFLILFLNYSCVERAGNPEMTGDYFGLAKPLTEPRIFAPKFISTGFSEFSSVFSKAGDEFYYCISGIPFTAIMYTKMVNNTWSEPAIINFSGKYWDGDMILSPDEDRLYFCSFRPVSGQGEPENNADIWYVRKSGNGWSDPVRLGNHINSTGNEFYPIFADNGNMYFSSSRQGGLGASDIYYCIPEGSDFSNPVNLGAPVNSENFEGDLCIAPDESFIIVTVYGRPDSHGSGDLYISFRDDTGGWSELKNMGEKINSNRNEHCPVLSPDGKYFFYSSGRLHFKNYSNTRLKYNDLVKIKTSPGNGMEDIYWVSTKIVEELR